MANINIYIDINFLISYIELKIEFLKYQKFLKICENIKKISNIMKVNNPKISIISPVYNRDKYILRFLISIQYQNFKDIEIIFIDDFSTDNSVKLIKKYKNIDKRINLLKNIINKGTFKSRNLGLLYSKGQYVIFPDPDDILSKNILNLCYRYAKKYKYKLIRFNIYSGNKKNLIFYRIINNLKNMPIYQPELSTYIFYGNNNELEIIYIISDSYFFLKKIGYYYIKNKISITLNLNKINDLRLKFSFIYLKAVFEYSKNSKYQKDMVNILFTNIYKTFEKKLSNIKKYNIFFNKVINNFLNCSFITDENKYILKAFKNKINVKNKYKKIKLL